MAYCKDPFGMNRRASKSLNSILNAGVRAAKAWEREAKAQQRARERQQAAYQRYLVQEERNRIRAIKAQEVAERRAEREREAAMRREERERAKAERERQKAAVLKAKNDELQRFEAEVASINEENEIWTNLHKWIDKIITRSDIENAIFHAISERDDKESNTLFTAEYPSLVRFKVLAEVEGEHKFHIEEYESTVRDATLSFGVILLCCSFSVVSIC